MLGHFDPSHNAIVISRIFDQPAVPPLALEYVVFHEMLGTGRYMLQFASRPPAAGGPVVDANEFTFYSGISNLDFEIGDGNPAAIAIRYHVAQHCYLSHMDRKSTRLNSSHLGI